MAVVARLSCLWMTDYDLAEALRLWLLKHKIEGEDRTQAKVARAIGVTEERFHHWLSGKNRIPLNTVLALARYFKFVDDAALLVEVRRLYPAPPAATAALSSVAAASARPMTRAVADATAASARAATAPRPRRRSAPRATARKTHGRQPGA